VTSAAAPSQQCSSEQSLVHQRTPGAVPAACLQSSLFRDELRGSNLLARPVAHVLRPGLSDRVDAARRSPARGRPQIDLRASPATQRERAGGPLDRSSPAAAPLPSPFPSNPTSSSNSYPRLGHDSRHRGFDGSRL
jgi:hypothetical protein